MLADRMFETMFMLPEKFFRAPAASDVLLQCLLVRLLEHGLHVTFSGYEGCVRVDRVCFMAVGRGDQHRFIPGTTLMR